MHDTYFIFINEVLVFVAVSVLKWTCLVIFFSFWSPSFLSSFPALLEIPCLSSFWNHCCPSLEFRSDSKLKTRKKFFFVKRSNCYAPELFFQGEEFGQINRKVNVFTHFPVVRGMWGIKGTVGDSRTLFCEKFMSLASSVFTYGSLVKLGKRPGAVAQ